MRLVAFLVKDERTGAMLTFRVRNKIARALIIAIARSMAMEFSARKIAQSR